MEVTAKLLPFPWLLAGWGLLIAVLAAATVTAPWRRLQDAEMQHALFGGIVALAVLWWIRAGILPGLGFHFFGVTALTLMFGWQFACLAAVPVLLAGVFTGHGDLGGLGLNALLLSEGFINGAAIAVLVATRPGWVWTFDDRRYLQS